MDDHRGISRHQKQERDQHKIEDLLLDTADHDVFELLHGTLLAVFFLIVNSAPTAPAGPKGLPSRRGRFLFKPSNPLRSTEASKSGAMYFSEKVSARKGDVSE